MYITITIIAEEDDEPDKIFLEKCKKFLKDNNYNDAEIISQSIIYPEKIINHIKIGEKNE